MTPINLQCLHQFRQEVYQIFEKGRDAAFEVLDALSVSQRARSAVAVSLAPGMQRRFSSVYKGVDRLRYAPAALRALWGRWAEAHEQYQVAGYGVYALDHTPYPRATAPTVSDRSVVHGANGQVIGHQYSLLGRVMHVQGAWLGVVDGERIPTRRTAVDVGAEQLARWRAQATQPFLVVADSEYAARAILAQADPGWCELLVRLRGNRVLYGAPPPRPPGKPGPAAQHGPVFKLNDPTTWPVPARRYELAGPQGGWHHLQVWHDLHVRQAPRQRVSLLRVQSYRADGRAWFQRPLWLLWTGPTDMDWPTFWQVYLRRPGIESFNQFVKQELGWAAARWGRTEHEERWTSLVLLAYWQLLLAAGAARDCPRPWEKPTAPGRWPSPARVQRDLPRLLGVIGTPAAPPKPRGIPQGRVKGFRPTPRPRYAVVHQGPATA